MKQLFRVLKPGASIRIVVPDGEFYIALYNKARAGEKIKFPYQSEREIVGQSHLPGIHARVHLR